MRNSISKGISSRFAELSRSGGGVRAVKLALCAAVLAEAAGAQPYADWRIDTFAGRPAFVDGGPAVEAELYNPAGVAVDGAGNLYIADASNNGIRKVDSTGTITTIAGTGELGFSGDGGPAVEAELYDPAGVAVDSAGNLYIADSGNQRIRKIDSTGTITTIAGTGEFGFSGDGGPAVEAELRSPRGVAVDSAGHVYITDTRNQRIRKIGWRGTITTIAGTGEFGFSGDGGPAAAARLAFPHSVAVDSAGNVYITDSGNRRIRKIDSTGTITTIAGTGEFGFSGDGGPAVEAELYDPYGVAVDSAGNVYIADTSNRRIRKIDSTGTIITIAGTGEFGFSGDGGQAVEAELRNPYGVAVDSAGNVYIADVSDHRIRKVDSTGTIITIAGTGECCFSGDGGPAVEAELRNPYGVAVDSAGNVYITDVSNHRIRKVDSTGTITTIAGTGEFGFSGDRGPAVEAELYDPYGVAVDSAGNVYITDVSNHRIRKVDSTGTITTIAGTGEFGFSGDGGPAAAARLAFPYGVAVDSAGNVYIADTGNRRIRKIDSTGTIITIAGTGECCFVSTDDGGPAAAARLAFPYGVAVDSAGNVYIADTSNRRIRKIDSTGTIITIAGTGEFGFSGDGGQAVEAELRNPYGVAVDSAGNVYIADTGNRRIRKIDSTGTIITIAGTGECCFVSTDDGGPAAAARLAFPYGVAVDSAGNVYIADTSNRRIRKLTPGGGSTPPNPTGPAVTLPGKPPAPTVSAATPNSLTVEWMEPENTGPAITDYDVQYREGGSGGFTDAQHEGTALTATLTGLSPDTVYEVQVRARNATGTGAWSESGEGRTSPQQTIDTVAGTGRFGFSGDGGPAAAARLAFPYGVAVDSAGNVYIADSGNQRIRKIDSTGTITTIAGTGEYGFSGDYGPAVEAELRRPRGVAVDSAGNVYIADTSNNGIRKVDSTGTITTIAGTGEFGFSGDGGPAVEAELRNPHGVAVDSAGNVYIADTSNGRIRKVDSTGTITTIAGTGEFGFSGDGGPAAAARLAFPYGVAVDSAGNVYIADSSNRRIRKVDSTGTITTIAGTGEFGFSGDGGPAVEAELYYPAGVAVDSAGNVYIADSGNQRIRKIGWRGTITTIAGTGEFGFSGDGGPAVAALLNRPGGVAVDGAGNIYIAEPDGHRIRKLTPVGPAATQIYYFPHLAVGASWQTTITYINYSAEEVSCRTDFLSDQGSPLMVSFADRGTVVSRTDVLAPGGSVHQETNVELSAPLAPGWARAICSGPVKASLLFRQHNSAGVPVAEAGVNAATVPATRFVTFVEQGEGKSGTGVAYANPSATSALVTFTAKNEAGQTLDSVVRTLLPGGHEAQNMVSLFGLSSFTGSLEVTSTAPIVSLSLNFEAAPVFSSLPPGELDAAAQGSTTYYFPHLAVGASWQTTITYINYSPQQVSCTTDFLSDQGAPLMVSFADRGTVVSRTDVLPPQGSVHQETNVQLNAPLAPGWARATCSGPVKASLLFRQHNSAGVPVAEAGVNAATVPATRFVTFAEQGEGQPGTGVAYANPSPTEAVITFTAKDEAGQTLDSVVRTLLPGGHEAQNMVSLFGLSSFIGSLEVATTAPIVSLSLNFEAAPVFSSLPPGELDASAQ